MQLYLPCLVCYKNLEQVNGYAAQLWATLVDVYSENCCCFSVSMETQELWDLESQGFVVSYENENRILFTLKGLREDVFCLQPEFHRPMSENELLIFDELDGLIDEF